MTTETAPLKAVHVDAVVSLLPCPFCGGAAELDPSDDSERHWFVWCTTCGCGTDTSVDPAESVQEWNRRVAG